MRGPKTEAVIASLRQGMRKNLAPHAGTSSRTRLVLLRSFASCPAHGSPERTAHRMLPFVKHDRCSERSATRPRRTGARRARPTAETRGTSPKRHRAMRSAPLHANGARRALPSSRTTYLGAGEAVPNGHSHKLAREPDSHRSCDGGPKTRAERSASVDERARRSAPGAVARVARVRALRW